MHELLLFGVRSFLILLIVSLVFELIWRGRFSDFLAGLRQGSRNFQEASREINNEIAELTPDKRPLSGKEIRWFLTFLAAAFVLWALVLVVAG